MLFQTKKINTLVFISPIATRKVLRMQRFTTCITSQLLNGNPKKNKQRKNMNIWEATETPRELLQAVQSAYMSLKAVP